MSRCRALTFWSKTPAWEVLGGTCKIANVPAGAQTITATFIGYHAQEARVTVPANAQASADFTLKESVLEMGEVVVAGTGYELKKKELTTSISTINSRDFELTPVSPVDQLLQSRVTGGAININSGPPGTGSRIRVRGVYRAPQSQTPVCYLDGVKLDNNDNFRIEQGTGGLAQNALSDILVADSNRIEVTKGGAALWLRGGRRRHPNFYLNKERPARRDTHSKRSKNSTARKPKTGTGSIPFVPVSALFRMKTETTAHPVPLPYKPMKTERGKGSGLTYFVEYFAIQDNFVKCEKRFLQNDSLFGRLNLVN